MFVDSHCHITYPREDGLTYQQQIENAETANVKTLLNVCVTHADFPKVKKPACEFKNVFCTYGIHPDHAELELNSTQLKSEIIKASKLKKLVGLGESGLDFYHNAQPKNAQIRSFEVHLEMSAELGLPLVIHSREAEDETIKVLNKHLKKYPKTKLLLHCFTSNQKLADFGIEHGIYISASGAITYEKSENLRNIFAKIPTKLLLIETDAPFLTPMPHRGKMLNQPAFVTHTAQCLAGLHNIPVEEIAAITTNNFFTLFKRAAKP